MALKHTYPFHSDRMLLTLKDILFLLVGKQINVGALEIKLVLYNQQKHVDWVKRKESFK